MAPAIAWKAIEHRVTPPFPTSDRSLANVKFRLDSNEEPTPDKDRRIESPQDWEELTPELFLDADVKALSSDTGLSPDDVVVSVICRDRTLCKFERVVTWPLPTLPADGYPLTEILDRFSRSTRLDVVVVATLRSGAPMPSPGSIPPEAALATKVFKVRARGRGLEVPITFIEPDELSRHGLDRRTVCFVRWTGEDVTRPPGELLEVWLNKDLEDKFQALNARRPGTAAAHIASTVVAQVYAEAIAQVLLADDHAGEADSFSLLHVVGQLIENELGFDVDEARRRYASPGGRAHLVPWSWRIAAADEAFASMRL